MLSGAFLFLMMAAILCYGVQGSLQVIFVRKYDAFVTAIYRNFSLIFTMAPILFFVPSGAIGEIAEHLDTLFLASATGAASMLLALSSAKYLPIGVGTAMRQIIQVSVALTLGVLFLNEWLTFPQFLLLITIVFIAVALALSRRDIPHLDPSMLWRGVGLTFAAGCVVAFSFFFFSILSREVHPFVAGYFWEAGIALFALFYCVVWFKFKGTKMPLNIPVNDAGKIAAVALFTIPATACYALALTKGPYAIASGLLTTTTFVALIMGAFLFKEHLSRWQIALIVVAVGLMFLMKVA